MRILKAVLFALVCALILWASGIAPALIPNNVQTANKRGNSNVFQLAANNSAAAAGTIFIDDGSGNSSTVAGVAIDPTTGDLSTIAGVSTGVGSGKTGYVLTDGATSGGQGFTVNDIAGTATLYVLPAAPSSGNFLKDNGSTTCPTLPTGAPSSCEGLAWAPAGGGGGGSANASCTFAITATGCATPTSINVAAFSAATPNQFLVQCFTGASTTQTAVVITGYTYTTGSGIVQTIAPTFGAAAAAGYCVVNGSGGGGSGSGCNTSTGSITSLPGSPASCDLFLPSDSQYSILRYNGSAWDYFFNGAKVSRPTGTYAWTNQGSCTNTTQTNGSITINCPTNGSADNVRIFDTATPSTPYTVTYRFRVQASNNADVSTGAVVLRESATGKFYDIGPEFWTTPCTGNTGQPCMSVVSWNSVTSTNTGTLATANSSSIAITSPWITIQISDAGGVSGNLTFSYSIDNGVTFQQLYQVARNSFFTAGPDHIGISLNNNQGSNGPMMNTLIGVN